MSYTATDLIAVAAAEVGYREKASLAQLEDPAANPGDRNITKYARDLYAAGYYGGHSKQFFAWCCCFTDWCHYMAAGKNRQEAQRVSCQSGIYGAACSYSARYYRQAGRFDQTPAVGAQIYFGDGSSWKHTGLVEAFDENTVTTIEGNTNNSVARKTYKRSSSTILGYGHPLFAEEDPSATAAPTEPTASPEEAEILLPTLRIGSRGGAVRTLQLLLNGKHAACLVVDGAFGPKTRQAVCAFQKSRDLPPDSLCTPATWEALLKA